MFRLHWIYWWLVVAAILLAGCTEQLPNITEPPESPPPERLSADPRQAIKLECFYALSRSVSGTSSRQINGDAVSDWNYLCNDLNAYTVMRDHYSGNSSVQDDFFTSPRGSNGLWPAPTDYGLQDGIGRAGQCPYFANLILYRSATYWDNNRFLRSYSFYINDWGNGYGPRQHTKPAREARISDVIQSKKVNGHRAIVVKIMIGQEGSTVTSVDVIDSNFVGGRDQEMIGRHVIASIPTGQPRNGTLSDLDSYFALKLNYR